MNKTRYVALNAVRTAFLLLVALPGTARTQSSLIASISPDRNASASPVVSGQPTRPANAIPAQQPTGAASRASAQKQMAQIEDSIMSLTLTDDQKAQIGHIHRDMQNRMELVVKDDKETIDQKEAMIEGLKRMRLHQILLVLTPEQRSELKKKLSAQQPAESQQNTTFRQSAPN